MLCHGGPIAEPDDAAYVLARTEGVVGFFGASSMERLPTEMAMTENMRRFKAIPIEKETRHEQVRDEGRGRRTQTSTGAAPGCAARRRARAATRSS